MMMLKWLTAIAAWALPRKCDGSSWTPTTNMNSRSPTWLSSWRIGIDASGNRNPLACGVIHPRSTRPAARRPQFRQSPPVVPTPAASAPARVPQGVMTIRCRMRRASGSLRVAEHLSECAWGLDRHRDRPDTLRGEPFGAKLNQSRYREHRCNDAERVDEESASHGVDASRTGGSVGWNDVIPVHRGCRRALMLVVTRPSRDGHPLLP